MTPEQHSVWLATEAAGRFGLTRPGGTGHTHMHRGAPWRPRTRPAARTHMPSPVRMHTPMPSQARTGATCAHGRAQCAYTCPVCIHMHTVHANARRACKRAVCVQTGGVHASGRCACRRVVCMQACDVHACSPRRVMCMQACMQACGRVMRVQTGDARAVEWCARGRVVYTQTGGVHADGWCARRRVVCTQTGTVHACRRVVCVQTGDVRPAGPAG